MREISWQDSYSVGVKALDEQHKKLLAHLNNIISLYDDAHSQDQIEKLIGDLNDYARTHFKSEEDLFVKHKYRDSEQHITEHRYYENQMIDFIERFKTSDESVKLKLLEFLADWWMGHIQGSDKDYQRFFNNCGVF